MAKLMTDESVLKSIFARMKQNFNLIANDVLNIYGGELKYEPEHRTIRLTGLGENNSYEGFVLIDNSSPAYLIFNMSLCWNINYFEKIANSSTLEEYMNNLNDVRARSVRYIKPGYTSSYVRFSIKAFDNCYPEFTIETAHEIGEQIKNFLKVYGKCIQKYSELSLMAVIDSL